MARKNRKTLADSFKNGNLPSETAFKNLIDSTLNIEDDGFEKTRKDGLKVVRLDNGKLISFYKAMNALSPMWSIGFDNAESGEESNKLIFSNGRNEHVMTLCNGETDQELMRVGVNKDDPQFELDVKGTIASDGRVGSAGKPVPADGNWHDITETLTGCQAFEIVAGVGGQDTDGKYALMHAFVLSAFNSKNNHISYHQAHFGEKCDRIELRWIPEEKEDYCYKLQIRVQSSYGENVWINYFKTRLWFDGLMNKSLVAQTEKQIVEEEDLKVKEEVSALPPLFRKSR